MQHICDSAMRQLQLPDWRVDPLQTRKDLDAIQAGGAGEENVGPIARSTDKHTA